MKMGVFHVAIRGRAMRACGGIGRTTKKTLLGTGAHARRPPQANYGEHALARPPLGARQGTLHCPPICLTDRATELRGIIPEFARPLVA